jgi:SAM-dependent methyltransferase
VTRNDRILALIDPATMRGVEVGPSFAPVLPKSTGADVTVVDHATAAELRAKYEGHGVDVGAIEEVDVIWSGGPLVPALQSRAPFDFIIASHLLEHLPDPIGFLNDCEKLLKPGGLLSLVLPDSRYCFDCLRPTTTIGQWVDARLGARTQHTPGAVLDHTLHAAQRGAIAWEPGNPTPLTMVHQRDHVDAMLAQAEAGDEYIDIHAWVFTLESFRYLIEMSRTLGYTSFVVADCADGGSEFFMSLRRPVDATSAEDRAAIFDHRLEAMLGAHRREMLHDTAVGDFAVADKRPPSLWRRVRRLR